MPPPAKPVPDNIMNQNAVKQDVVLLLHKDLRDPKQAEQTRTFSL